MPLSIDSLTEWRCDLLAVLEDAAGVPLPVGTAKDAHRQLGASGAHEAREADDLAPAHVAAKRR